MFTRSRINSLETNIIYFIMFLIFLANYDEKSLNLHLITTNNTSTLKTVSWRGNILPNYVGNYYFVNISIVQQLLLLYVWFYSHQIDSYLLLCILPIIISLHSEGAIINKRLHLLIFKKLLHYLTYKKECISYILPLIRIVQLNNTKQRMFAVRRTCAYATIENKM